MTTPHEHESSTDVGPGEALKRAIDALPAERALPTDAFAQLQQAMTAEARSGAAVHPVVRPRRNRLTVPLAIFGVAALLALALANSLSRSRRDSASDAVAVGGTRRGAAAVTDAAASALLPEERTDPRVLAVLDETRNWREASSDSLRSVRWPVQARAAIESALASTETALESARRAVREDPGDAVARDAIAVLRAKQLVLLQRAMTLLDEI
jgi:hypothetical protein